MPFFVIFQPPANAGEGRYKPKNSAISTGSSPRPPLPRPIRPRQARNSVTDNGNQAGKDGFHPVRDSFGWKNGHGWNRALPRGWRKLPSASPAPTARPPSAQGNALGTAPPMNFSALKGPNIVTLQATSWSDAIFPGSWPGLRKDQPSGSGLGLRRRRMEVQSLGHVASQPT